MSEYPEDVMKAARGVASDVMHAASNCGVDAVADDIARAIMTERQRCYDLVYWMALGEGSDFGLRDEIMNGDIPDTPPPGYPGN